MGKGQRGGHRTKVLYLPQSTPEIIIISFGNWGLSDHYPSHYLYDVVCGVVFCVL